MIQRPRIDNRLRRFITAEHDEQVGDHGGLLVVVEVDDIFTRQLVEGHLHHRHSTFYNLFAGGDDG